MVKIALDFSQTNNIVESKEWANLMLENGLDGLCAGHKFTEEHKKKQSEMRTGEKH